MKLTHFNQVGELLDPPVTRYRGAVVSIHGANTRGAWQKDITPILQDAAIRHEAVDYGTRRLRALLGSSSGICQRILETYEKQLHYHDFPGAIGHSLGSFALGEALKKWKPLTFKRVVLCGCILPRNYPWTKLASNGQVERVWNEVACRDIWARLAPIRPGWGTSGCKGFNNGGSFVYNNEHEWSGHSEVLTRLHCKSVWIPFLLGES